MGPNVSPRKLRAHESRCEVEFLLRQVPAEALAFVNRVAPTQETVLLVGETGSGKTYLAGIIHELSPRFAQPFLRVNCGAIPESLFEREMFGHVRGAFTDAKESQPGLFETASGGTLFLDEISELPLHVQCKLLAVLEEKSIRRLGTTAHTSVDVRIIAATNTDLGEMVRDKRFRQDLYHRLAVVKYRVPPLRERRNDIPAVARSLLSRNRLGGLQFTLSPEALDIICNYDWPGNIRELDNALRHGTVFAEDGIIQSSHLPEEIRTFNSKTRRRVDGTWIADSRYMAPGDIREEMEAIREALQAQGGNRTRAAKQLGMSRSTLWAKLQRDRNES